MLILRVELLLHMQVGRGRVRDAPRIHLAYLAEHRFVIELGLLNELVCLVDRLSHHWVEGRPVLTKLDGVVDGVLDLRDHVLGALELEVA